MAEGSTSGSGLLSIAVVGAHLEQMPLHHELVSCGATLMQRTATAPTYRLYRLDGPAPHRPGLVRVRARGRSIEVEVYRLPLERVGEFLTGVAAPLAIGTVELADGSTVFGFVCEPIALDQATDITEYGGWRAYLAGQGLR